MRRKAFTLLEVLTVIGIIAILVTLVTLGVGQIGKVGREKATQIAMENLKGLVAERKNTGGVTALNQIYQSQNWTTIGGNPAGKMGAPGSADALAAPVLAQGASTIEAQNAMGATLLVMNYLNSLPNNKKTLGGLPANATKMVSATVTNSNPPLTISAPVMLDGWGNPILYAPPGGLTGVFVDNSGKPQATLITAKDGQGFWVSAGPDGNYSILPGSNGQVGNPPPDADDIAAGDDNVYSFNN